jgi:hypothetical protein
MTPDHFTTLAASFSVRREMKTLQSGGIAAV